MKNPIRSALPDKSNISFVSGNFNVLHPGHLRLLRFAAEIGDALVVGVNPDHAPGVSVPGHERLQNISALDFVLEAKLLDVPVEQFIEELRPEFVVKGKEFEDRSNIEAAALEVYGGQLIFSSGEMQFSSMALLDSEFRDTTLSTIRKPGNFPKRYNFTNHKLISVIENFSNVKALVIGDLIIDDYITCEPLGMSQEDPTIVVSPIEEKRFVGGSGVVAAHARNLGADVRFVSVTGNDDVGGFAYNYMQGLGIDFCRHIDETRPTTLKQRFRAGGKTLLRVSHLRQHAINKNLQEKILKEIEANLYETDIILFADFNYGCLPVGLVENISKMAAARGIPICADSQASSQLSDISRFRNTKLITPTEREARLALNDSSSGLAVLASKLSEKSNVENVIITLGSEGILLYGKIDGTERTDRLPAFNTVPKDVAGAGDSLFTCAALALASNASIWEAAYIGEIAAACQTGRVGNSPIRLSDLYDEIALPAEDMSQ